MVKIFWAIMISCIFLLRVFPPQPALVEASELEFFHLKKSEIEKEHMPKRVLEAKETVDEEIQTVYVFDPVLEIYYSTQAFYLLEIETLMHFKGVGEVTAKSIRSYMDENGPLNAFEDLIHVRGIGEKKLRDILENSKQNE